MKTKSSLNPFCLAFGHNYFRMENGDSNKNSVFCKSCMEEFKFSKNGNIIEVPSMQYSLFSKKDSSKV